MKGGKGLRKRVRLLRVQMYRRVLKPRITKACTILTGRE